MARERQFYDYLISKVVIRTVLLLLVLVFGFLAVDNWVARWDLTEDKRFSISPASHRIAASLPDPLTIRAYFSGRIPEWIVPMQRQVFDILAEYEAHSNGKIKVERYDPLESASAKSEAESYGVRQMQIAVREATGVSAQQVYGSIVLIYGDRAPQVINIAERYPEGYEGLSVLESELSGKIHDLTQKEKRKVGLTGYLEREGGGNPMMGMQQPRPEFNELRSKLGSSFEIEDVDLDREDLDPAKVPLLLVVRPKEMSDVAVFRLDQYLMKGGRVICFITQGALDQGWDRRFTYTPFKTGLDAWFEHEGVRVPNEFVLQLRSANVIRVPQMVDIGGVKMQAEMPVPNWFWPVIDSEGSIDQDNPAVQKLRSIDLFWPHPVEVLENRLEGRQATVLVRSHANESWRWKDLRRVDMRSIDPEADLPSRSDLAGSPLVVALEGTFPSYFADRPVPPSLASKKEEKSGDAEGEGGEEKKAEGPDVIKVSPPTQLVVVGNAVFISDAAIGGGGRQGDEASEITASLAMNLANWLAGSPELIALRAKRYTKRSLKDTWIEEQIEVLKEKADKGEVDEAGFRHSLDEIRESAKDRQKRSRWLNVVLPLFLVWLCGAVLWVLRAASRGGTPRIPPPAPPKSLAGGGTDS